MNAPERIWVQWPEANKRYVAFSEPPKNEYDEAKTGYIRADLYDTQAAEIADLRRQLAEAREACNQSRLAFAGLVSVDSALRKLDNLKGAAK